ncbi:WD-40 repeat-containing protein MSI4 [Porphyridium purpureum]|uniref:WD-40 repeat-containing protein MSI4 n=1 Tax=Porphyridium purpureum TaxID=35688 RepID=A0A5J4Z6T5_PORPP|nr:WD-40 repeat-containing protein MSI4 [Porphyridium purpureum]|eukprot:POR6545..scf295_1
MSDMVTGTRVAMPSQQLYDHWRVNHVPILYDHISSRKLGWPSQCVLFGNAALDALVASSERADRNFANDPLLSMQETRAMLLAERTGQSREANTLMLMSAKIPGQHTTRVADSVRRWSENAKDAYVQGDLRVVKRIIHPDEVNRAQLLANELVVTHADHADVYVWDLKRQPHRKEPFKDKNNASVPDATLVGHEHDAPFALATHSQPSASAEYSDALVASGDNNGQLCVWSISAGQIPSNPHSADIVTDAQVQNSERTSARSSKLMPLLREQVSPSHAAINDVALYPESTQQAAIVLSACSDRALTICDSRQPGVAQRVHDAHRCDINSCDWNPHQLHMLLSGGDDGQVKLWDSRVLGDGDGDTRPMQVFEEHRSRILELKWNSVHANVFASGSEDACIAVWDLNSARNRGDGSQEQHRAPPITSQTQPPMTKHPELIFRHRGHQHSIASFDWCPAKSDAWLMASVSEDFDGSTLQIWRMLDLIYQTREKSIGELRTLRLTA